MKENKLIAEFMGMANERHSDGRYLFTTDIDELKGADTRFGEELYFHVSWDWLMPVVEKIESLGYELVIVESRCYVKHNTDHSIEELFHIEKIGSKIECTYNAVVEFIKEYNPTPKFDREIYNIILVHVARTWERFRVVQNHQEMPLDNIQSAEELPNIAQKILENKVVQEFLINRDGSVWDKFGDGCSDTFIERISREYIIANYYLTNKTKL